MMQVQKKMWKNWYKHAVQNSRRVNINFFSIDVSNSSDRLHLKGGSACGLAINTTCEPSKIFVCILECPVNWFTEYILKCLLFKSLWMCQSGFTIAVHRVFFYNSIVECAKVLCYLYRFCYHWPCSQGMCRSVAKDCLKCWQHSMKCTELMS